MGEGMRKLKTGFIRDLKKTSGHLRFPTDLICSLNLQPLFAHVISLTEERLSACYKGISYGKSMAPEVDSFVEAEWTLSTHTAT